MRMRRLRCSVLTVRPTTVHVATRSAAAVPAGNGTAAEQSARVPGASAAVGRVLAPDCGRRKMNQYSVVCVSRRAVRAFGCSTREPDVSQVEPYLLRANGASAWLSYAGGVHASCRQARSRSLDWKMCLLLAPDCCATSGSGGGSRAMSADANLLRALRALPTHAPLTVTSGKGKQWQIIDGPRAQRVLSGFGRDRGARVPPRASFARAAPHEARTCVGRPLWARDADL
jgi:hypothetical protein